MSFPIQAIDNFLPKPEQDAVWALLRGPGWSFGAFSRSDGHRYFYKHFAGFFDSGAEPKSGAEIEQTLRQWPAIAAVWSRLKAGPLANQALGRCYANGMPPAAEGGLHQDSNVPSHLTAIYYPHPAWDPDLAGETLFYNTTKDEVVGAVFPKPNRLVIFPGIIPHVARPISARANDMRITLMFKTTGPIGQG